MASKDRLKSLHIRLNKLNSEIEEVKKLYVEYGKDFMHKKDQIKAIQAEIQFIKEEKTLTVSEHALLRYMERVKGIDLEEIQKEILDDSILIMVEKLGGNGSYPHPEGFKIKMKDYNVVTIIKDVPRTKNT